jgi:hypothetical protein
MRVSSARAARMAIGVSLAKVAEVTGKSIPTVRVYELTDGEGVSEASEADIRPVYDGFRAQARDALSR